MIDNKAQRVIEEVVLVSLMLCSIVSIVAMVMRGKWTDLMPAVCSMIFIGLFLGIFRRSVDRYDFNYLGSFGLIASGSFFVLSENIETASSSFPHLIPAVFFGIAGFTLLLISFLSEQPQDMR